MPTVYFLWAAWKKSDLQLLMDTCLRDTWRCLMFSQKQHNTSLKSSFAQGHFYPLPKRRSNSSWEGRQGPLGTLIRWWEPWSDSFFEQNKSSGCAGLQKRFLKYLFKKPSHAVWEQWKIRCIFCLCALSRPFCCGTKPCLLCDAAASQGLDGQRWTFFSEHHWAPTFCSRMTNL